MDSINNSTTFEANIFSYFKLKIHIYESLLQLCTCFVHIKHFYFSHIFLIQAISSLITLTLTMELDHYYHTWFDERWRLFRTWAWKCNAQRKVPTSHCKMKCWNGTKRCALLTPISYHPIPIPYMCKCLFRFLYKAWLCAAIITQPYW